MVNTEQSLYERNLQALSEFREYRKRKEAEKVRKALKFYEGNYSTEGEEVTGYEWQD